MQNKTANNFIRLWQTIILLTAAWHGTVNAATASPDAERLLEQAYYWQLNGRDDLAESTWQRILRVDTQQPEALFQLGVRNAQRGDIQIAQDYLGRLRAAQPANAYVARLSATIALGRIDPQRLSEARRLAQTGKANESVAAYRSLFGKTAPEGALAVEFYLTLGGTDGGWEPTRDYFRALVNEQPKNPHYRLLLARHLSYHEGTRREGIGMLAELEDVQSISNVAATSWRQALSWLQAGPGDENYFTTYLARFPDTPDLRIKLRRLQAQRALERNDLDAAATGFEELRRAAPRDASALGGLGLVRLKQKRFHDATELLKEASSLSPADAHNWQTALKTAQFWDLFDQANIAREAKDFARAEALLRQALDNAPRETEGSVILGSVLLEQGRMKEAEQLFDMVLAERPDDIEAQLGLAQILTTQGRLQEASQLVSKLPLDDPRTALAKARIALQQGDVGAALAETDAVLTKTPNSPAALDAKVAVLGAAGELGKALAALEQLPLDARTDARTQTQRQLWVRYQIQRVSQLVDVGLLADAKQLVIDMEQALGNNPAYAAELADAWSKVGDTERALPLVRRAIANSATPTPVLRLQLAGLLMRKGMYAELESQLQSIAVPELSPTQRRDFDNLRAGLAVSQADAAREKGDLAGAYDWLAPTLTAYPDNSSLKAGLGRLHVDAGDLTAAAPLYEAVAAQDPTRLDAWTGAIDTRLKLREFDRATKLRDQAFQQFPNNPQLLVLAARLARARGDNAEALRYFRLARAHPDNLLLIEAGSTGAPTTLVYTDESGNKRTIEKDIDVLAAPPVEPEAPAKADAASARARTAALQPEIDSLVPHENNQDAAAATSLRLRNGEAGLSELTEYSLPVEGSFTASNGIQLWGRLTPLSLDAGFLSSQNAAARFGTNAFNAGTIASADGQSDSGIATDIGISTDSLSFDIGETAFGFTVKNVVGGLSWRPRLTDSASLGLSIARREVRDSLLSYAGTTDTRSGETWGGVAGTAGSLDFGIDTGDFGMYATTTIRNLTGERVADNRMANVAAGFYAPVIRAENHVYSLSANLAYMSYDKNLRYFSLGHGGYFSPQSYISLVATIERSGRTGRMSHRIGASVGTQSFREDAVDYFPNDAAMQSALVAQAASDPKLETRYAGQSITDVLYSTRGELEYLVADQISIGGWVSWSKAENYEEFALLAYVRHWIAPRSVPVSFPPDAFRLHP